MHLFFSISTRRLFPLLLLLLFSLSLSAQWSPCVRQGGEEAFEVKFADGVWLCLTRSGVYRSLNDGLSWQPSFELDQPGGNALSWHAADHSWWLLSKQQGVFRSPDGGESWEPMTGFDLAGQTPDLAVMTDEALLFRNNKDFYRFDLNAPGGAVFAGHFETYYYPNRGGLVANGNDLWANNNDSLFLSTDNGGTWTFKHKTSDAIFGFAVQGNTIAISCYDFMERSLNYGASWNLGGSSNKVIFLKKSGNKWYGSRPNEAPRAWNDDVSGWSFVAQLNNTDYQIKDAGSNGNIVILATPRGLARSVDNGVNWEIRNAGLGFKSWNWQNAGNSPIPYGLGNYLCYHWNFTGDGGANWFKPAALDLSSNSNYYNSNYIYHNGAYFIVDDDNRLYRSVGDLGHWSAISGPFTANTYSDLIADDNHFYRIEVTGSSALTIYTSTDHGVTWTQTGTLPPNNQLMQLHNDSLVRWKAPTGLLRSSDNGNTWTQLPGMGLDSFTGVSYSPRVRSFGGKLFVYSEDGIAVSADDGLTFIMINQALSDSTGTPMGTQHLASDGTRVAVIAGGSVWYSPDLGASWTEIVDNLPYSSFSFENMAMHNGYLYISLNDAEAPLWRRLLDNVVPLSGYVWRDDNNNGQPDPGEPPYPGAFLHAGSALFATSGTDGTFEMLGDLNAGAVEIELPYSWVIPNPASQPFTDSSAGLNFGLYFPPDVVDLSVNQTNFTVFRPGFNETISLTYQNHGIAPADAVLRFVPADPLQLVNANPAPDAISGDTLVWNLSSIPGFGSWQVLVKVHTPAATAIGSSVTTWASITPTQADAIPVDNEHVLTEAVVGSYDPNDKRSNRERISPDELTAGEPIIYTIRFQNTGNFPADFVRITDTLDFSKLDISSFRVLATSHPCQTTLSGAGNLEFFFGNIQLPPESQDEPGSHGFVQFQIRPKAGLPLGATLRNKAYIYFDFNAPVLTNTAETVVAWPLAAFQPTKADALLISPNPAVNVARIELPAASGLLRVFDATGRLVMQQTAEDRTIRIDLAGLAAGVYAVEWSGNQAGHRRIGRLVKL